MVTASKAAEYIFLASLRHVVMVYTSLAQSVYIALTSVAIPLTSFSSYYMFGDPDLT